MTKRYRALSRAALAAALALSTLALAACEPGPTNAPEGGRAPAGGASPAATNAAPAPPAAPPRTPGEIRPPLGQEDSIEGRVIGLSCYRKNAGNLEATIQCARANVGQREVLAVLGKDGTVYAGEGDARRINEQLRYFIGQDVTVQGKDLGDAPDLGWEGVKVKKFDFHLVRRVGDAPADAPKSMNPNIKLPNSNARPRQQ